MKRFVALARVSSREQEREGFSLAVQETALRQYVDAAGGELVRFFRIAETASRGEERKTFREMVAYAKKHAEELDALLFYKVDRAARNLFDYVELERLESEYGLAFISVSQQTDNNPAGRMMRRTLANMASFYTEQQSVDVREGLARRVQEGWFVSKAPYGYKNVRRDGRSISAIDSPAAANVKRIFHLYAYEPLTLDALRVRLADEGHHLPSQSAAICPQQTPCNAFGSLLHRRGALQGAVVSRQARPPHRQGNLGARTSAPRWPRLPLAPNDLRQRSDHLRTLRPRHHWRNQDQTNQIR